MFKLSKCQLLKQMSICSRTLMTKTPTQRTTYSQPETVPRVRVALTIYTYQVLLLISGITYNSLFTYENKRDLYAFFKTKSKIPLDDALRFFKHLQFNCLLDSGHLVYSRFQCFGLSSHNLKISKQG